MYGNFRDLWALWVVLWVVFFTHIAHTKRRASTSVWVLVGNVGSLKSKLWITLYSTVYPYMGTYTALPKKHCTKGVMRFKFAFFITHNAHTLKWYETSLAARRQFAHADSSAKYPIVKRPWLPPLALAICQWAFITWLIYIDSYTNCEWSTAIISIAVYLI
jgi:hypothetical protein